MDVSDEIVFQEEPRRYLYAKKEYRSVTDRIKAVGFGPDFSFVNPSVLEYARQRGNAVDLALTYHHEGDLNMMSIDPAIQGYIDAALKFDRECGGPVVTVHARLVSTDPPVAGTLDVVRFVRGHRSLIDWKTGADNPLQTWMYTWMWNKRYPPTPIYRRYGLRLKANGTYVLQEHTDPDDGPACMAILQGDEKEIERWRVKYGRAITTKINREN